MGHAIWYVFTSLATRGGVLRIQILKLLDLLLHLYFYNMIKNGLTISLFFNVHVKNWHVTEMMDHWVKVLQRRTGWVPEELVLPIFELFLPTYLAVGFLRSDRNIIGHRFLLHTATTQWWFATCSPRVAGCITPLLTFNRISFDASWRKAQHLINKT